ncbi:MAG: hybrid sensor histidine kinase/response regulator [Myxococcota bacterium]|nr:hybrid sensor histidine kinase/response regulator [Myxococcota bacterium]
MSAEDRMDHGRTAGRGDGWLLAFAPPRGVRVLLVAKDSAFRRLVVETLTQRRHQVCTGADIHEAMALGREHRFEVALVLLPAQGVAELLHRLRDLDPDMEVVWAPPPVSVARAEALVTEAAARGRGRLAGLLSAARTILEPRPPEETVERLLQQARAVLRSEASIRPQDPLEPAQALIWPDRRRLRIPLWEGGPLPEDNGVEDGGHRLELVRSPEEAELSPADLQRAGVIAALGSLALTRAHCEELLADLYRDLDHARAQLQRSSVDDTRGQPGLTGGTLGPLERLAGVLAHELNNPLTFVLANLTCLEEDLAVLERELETIPGTGAVRQRCEELREVLKEAQGGAHRVREVVADLTTLGARQGGRDRQPVAVEEVVRAALRIARREVERRAHLVVELEPRLPRVEGSASRLGQVLLNLLINAIQALPVGDPSRHCVRVRATSHGDQVCLSVSDTGGGIPQETLPRVFEPGYTTKPHGEGLGLAICREIVRTHGGDVRIESTPGQGTTVTVTLPALGRAAQGDDRPGA